MTTRPTTTSRRHRSPSAARGRRFAPAAIVVLAALLVSACAGIPSHSAPVAARSRVVGAVAPPTDAPLPVPQTGDNPRTIVLQFLAASAESGGRHDAAKRFLTPRAASQWADVSGATIIAPGPFVRPTSSPSRVILQYQKIGSVDEDGTYEGSGPDDSEVSYEFNLEQVAGQWRISDAPPPGVFVTQADFSRNFTSINLYFLNHNQNQVVPDPRYFSVPTASLANQVTQALIDGPSKWLAPGVNTAIPADVTLREPVIAESPLEVDLAGMPAMTGPQVRSMAAQFAWTLDQVRAPLNVEGVRLYDERAPISVPGLGSGKETIDNWRSYDPEALPASASGYAVDHGVILRTSDAAKVGGRSTPPGYGLRAVSVSPDQRYIAGLKTVGHKVDLYVGRYSGPLKKVQTATAFSTPTWLPGGLLLVVRNGRELLRLPAASPAAASVSTEPALAAIAPISSLRVSLDGSRVAIVSTRDRGVLYVGVMGTRQSAISIDSVQPLVGAPPNLAAAVWSTSTQLAALAPSATSFVNVLWRISIDGSVAEPLSNDGLPDRPAALAAAPNQLTLVHPADQQDLWYYNDESSSWSPLRTAGNVPVQGSAPNYPG
jgi:Lipoprotein LpqB beta-propeller domain/Sporulation and spore germination